MFGTENQKGISLPQILKDKPQARNGQHDNLSINGTKPHPVKPFNPKFSTMLPHISQKSQRSVPRKVYNVYSIKRSHGSMLEAIEIYKKKSKAAHTTYTQRKEADDVVFQSVPCPTPEELSAKSMIKEAPEEIIINVETRQRIEPIKAVKQPTTLPPVTLSLQKRLEKLAKHKSKLMRKQPHPSSSINENFKRLTIENCKKISLPTMEEQQTNERLYPKFTSKLPEIKINSDKETSLSYQLLEIPLTVSKPDQKRRIMFTHSDYDTYQHNKFSNARNQRLAIVEGPDSHINAAWDYNKFLYLNAKI
ncbi:uncharacterized protein [Watersipora subatra]|uniref:uncharacterized protein n=1 Tax=Watersipora subatra TaxID=2589382 RepID=UPI00355B773F